MHRIPALRRLKERSDRASGLPPSESTSIGLGVVGSVGFLALLGVMLLRRRRAHGRAQLLRSLAVLNLLAVLLAAMGGFGYLLALIVAPEIRGYSRMSVIIAFLSLFAVVLLLERLCGPRRRLGWGAAAIVAVVGLFDQVTPAAVRSYESVKDAYLRDAWFADRIEASVPQNAMIFQLPYHRFPEGGPVLELRMADYDHMRTYLHSRTLRWSYPAIYNRAADAWISSVSQRPAAELLEAASATGFAGILIDRNGYPDAGAEIEAAFGDKLGRPSAVSPDKRLAFFSLEAYNTTASANLSQAARAERRRSALETVALRWMDGFFGPERGPKGTFHWCPDACQVQIENPAALPLTATIKMTLFAAQPPTSVDIEGDLLAEHLELPRAGAPLVRTVVVSPGRHVLRFSSRGAPAQVPLDPRRLVWFVQSADIETQPPR
jgi:phosphoglycerol transferase